LSTRAEQLHASHWQGVLHITGGGSQIIAELLSTPGASNTVLEVTVPYSQQALAEILGRSPDSAASPSTARLLAMAAYERAQDLGGEACFGLGVTASLGSNRKKKSEHRAHWAIQTASKTTTFDAVYRGEREDEEAALLDQLWASLQRHLLDVPSAEFSNEDGVQVAHHEASEKWRPLIHDRPHIWSSEPHDGKLLLPGSFNPLHTGHTDMLAVAEQLTEVKGAYELCVKNADKPSLDYLTIYERLIQFGDEPVWLTNTPTYVEKARQFPGTTFALGVDTLVRIIEVRFYNDRQALLELAITTLADLQTKFLVFGRNQNGHFVTLDDLHIPKPLRDLCTQVPESIYRNDMSSTVLRNRD